MIVLFGTEWGSQGGGISSFNTGLAQGLAELRPGRVACVVTKADHAQRRDALNAGVILFVVPQDENGFPIADKGRAVAEINAGTGAEVELWVGHDVITGFAAASAAAALGGRLALIHHMDYPSYQNLGGGRGEDAISNHKRQIDLFCRPDAVLFGVGSWLRSNVETLGINEARLLVPGFPSIRASQRRNTAQLQAVVAGRFTTKDEQLKRLTPAIEGFASAVARSRKILPSLSQPSLKIIGLESQDRMLELEKLARDKAGGPVNIMPMGFDPDPKAAALLASRANLVIVPSAHEGFGLVGWEAIGTGTPLIIGRNTGLADQLQSTLDGVGNAGVQVVDLDGSEQDVQVLDAAVVKVAGDLLGALNSAARVRDRLVNQLGCTWLQTARDLLSGVDMLDDDRPALVPVAPVRASFAEVEPSDHLSRFLELRLSIGQSVSVDSMELIAEVRCGTIELEQDGWEIEVGLKRIALELSMKGARLSRSSRLGDPSRAYAGLEARSGGKWILSAQEGAVLINRVLGDESLAVVESSNEGPIRLSLDATAGRSDFHCEVRHEGKELRPTTERVLAAFIKEKMTSPGTSQITLSTAVVQEKDVD